MSRSHDDQKMQRIRKTISLTSGIITILWLLLFGVLIIFASTVQSTAMGVALVPVALVSWALGFVFLRPRIDELVDYVYDRGAERDRTVS